MSEAIKPVLHTQCTYNRIPTTLYTPGVLIYVTVCNVNAFHFLLSHLLAERKRVLVLYILMRILEIYVCRFGVCFFMLCSLSFLNGWGESSRWKNNETNRRNILWTWLGAELINHVPRTLSFLSLSYTYTYISEKRSDEQA